jgi:Homeodomain-like domain
MTLPSLSPYLRAARKKFGDPDAIFETAAGELEPRQLGRLADVLRETHPNWKLRKPQRDPLIDALLDAGWSAARISDRLGINRKTVYRRAKNRAASSEGNPTDGLDKRSKCPKTGSRDGQPILSFFAHGCDPDEHRRILELLGEA